MNPEDIALGKAELHLSGLSPWPESVQVTLECKNIRSTVDDPV